MDPQAYMSELASRLNSTDSKGLLMRGMSPQKARQTAPSHAKAAPAKPAPAANSAAAPVVKPAAEAKAASVPAVKPQSPAPQTPAPQVATMTVWNGLSPENRAAQKGMEQLAALRAAKTPAVPQIAQTPGTGGTVAAATNPATQTTASSSPPQVSPLNQALMTAKPGLALWTKPTPANLAEKVVLDGLATASGPEIAKTDPSTPPERAPWSLGTDLDKYRAHAVKEGTRDSGQSLKKALERAGMTLGDSVNVFILGYGSDRAKPFRVNDGKGLLDEPGRVPQQAGNTAVSFADGVYSLADLITLDSLPDPLKDAYKENNPLVRPLIFTGRTIGGVFKTTEEIGNAVTWGYFDNVTGCIGIVVEDILELFKHAGQAATNLVRAPVRLIAGKKEGTERAMDWVLLVPLEFISNSVEMKGIANMDDYTTAFEDKGVIGSVLEFGGSTFLVYRAVDELIDELKDKDRSRRSSSETTPDNPPEPPVDPPVTPPSVPGSEVLFILEGEWPTTTTPGLVYFEGKWPAVTVILE